jgi:vacuolar protein sorting-associated protein 29
MSANFGELVLVLGDLHIPERANKIPAPFKRMLVPNKMQHVICTGNASPELCQELWALAPAFHCVAGDCDAMDENANIEGHQNVVSMNSLPETRVLQIGQFRVGVVHGHQIIPWGSKEAVERMRRKLQVDILVTGHTHQSAVVVDEANGFYHINPVRSMCALLCSQIQSLTFLSSTAQS